MKWEPADTKTVGWTPALTEFAEDGFVAYINGYRLEAYYDDREIGEDGPCWCWRVTDPHGEQDGYTADSLENAKRAAIDSLQYALRR